MTLALLSFLLVTATLFPIPHVSAAISIDLNVTPATITIYGNASDDQSGNSVSSGDINGDGIADVIIGAANADPGGRDKAGEAYVIYGSASMPDTVTIDLNVTQANVTIYGNVSGDCSGRSVSSGDVNGDGIDDVIIGASYAAPGGRVNAGAAYVIYGNASMPDTVTIDLNATQANVTIYGNASGDELGHSVSSGDINNDGIADVIIGAVLADPGGRNLAGEAYVIYGSASMPDTIDLSVTPANVTIYGNAADNRLGVSVSSGDINGDGIADVIIGAPWADPPPGGRGNAGAAYVIYGSASMPDTVTIDLSVTPANVTIYGVNAWDWVGYSVSSGDVNGDDIADVITGAIYADPGGRGEAGEAYVIYGSASMPDTVTIDLSDTAANVTIYGNVSGDQLGYSVSSGDVNGDGIADVIIGAYAADPGGRDLAGEAYVIYGSASMPDTVTIDLNVTQANVTIYGNVSGDHLGSSVSSGDINNDGIADVIIGASTSDPGGRGDAGAAYVICDAAPPGDVTGFTATAGDEQVSLSWTNPSNADFVGTKVIRKEGSYPVNVSDGAEVCNRPDSPGSTDSYTNTSLTNGITYYYTAFAYDEVPWYSSAVDSAQDYATPTAAPPPVPVPEFNAVGLLALVGILSVLLAVATLKRKREWHSLKNK